MFHLRKSPLRGCCTPLHISTKSLRMSLREYSPVLM